MVHYEDADHHPCYSAELMWFSGHICAEYRTVLAEMIEGSMDYDAFSSVVAFEVED